MFLKTKTIYLKQMLVPEVSARGLMPPHSQIHPPSSARSIDAYFDKMLPTARLCLKLHFIENPHHHHPLLLLLGASQGLDEASPSHFILSHSLQFQPSFSLISSFFFHCAFPGFLQPTSPSLILRIPIQSTFFCYS
jgi:hypothetical protein